MSELDKRGQAVDASAAAVTAGGRFRKAAEAVLSAERLAVDRAGNFYRHDGQHWKRLTRLEIEALIFQHTKFVRSRWRSRSSSQRSLTCGNTATISAKSSTRPTSKQRKT